MRGGRQPAVVVLSAILATGLASAAGLPVEVVDPIAGKPVELAAGARALHVVFFGTWCPPCMDELEQLSELDARWHERGYRLVLVAVQDRHSAERLKRFKAEHRPPGKLVYDGTGAASRALGGSDLPTHIVYDAAGREVARSSGLNGEVEQAVAELLKGRQRAAERP